MNDLEDTKLPRVFQSLLDSVADALGVLKPEPPTTPLVELG